MTRRQLRSSTLRRATAAARISVVTRLAHRFHAVIYPSDGAWIAHCLELDIVTQGDSAEDAVTMLDDALRTVAYENLRHGQPPFQFRSAPREDWERFRNGDALLTHLLQIEGEPFPDDVTIAPAVCRAG